MSIINLVTILITVFMSACAQLLLKLGVTAAIGAGHSFNNGLNGIIQILLSPLIIIGILIYGGSVLVWIWVLSRVELSVAYPFVGLSFVFTLLFGVLILGEGVSITKILGTVMITAGCVLVANSNPT
jgi:drug/metabolite transporter (DMT)-like permease